MLFMIVRLRLFSQPFFANQDGQATRQFNDLVNNSDHPFGKHPTDYTLFLIGIYDDETAELESMSKISLGNGVEFKTPDPQLGLPI